MAAVQADNNTSGPQLLNTRAIKRLTGNDRIYVRGEDAKEEKDNQYIFDFRRSFPANPNVHMNQLRRQDVMPSPEAQKIHTENGGKSRITQESYDEYKKEIMAYCDEVAARKVKPKIDKLTPRKASCMNK